MIFKHNGSSWMVKKTPSIYTNRHGKYDATILKDGTWGARENDGKLYNSMAKFCCEDGSLIFQRGDIPSFINIDWLKQNNFIDK